MARTKPWLIQAWSGIIVLDWKDTVNHLRQGINKPLYEDVKRALLSYEIKMLKDKL